MFYIHGVFCGKKCFDLNGDKSKNISNITKYVKNIYFRNSKSILSRSIIVHFVSFRLIIL